MACWTSPLDLYCSTCHTPICFHGTVKDHLGHEYDLLIDVAGKHQTELCSEADVVAQRQSELQDGIARIEREEAALVAEAAAQKEREEGGGGAGPGPARGEVQAARGDDRLEEKLERLEEMRGKEEEESERLARERGQELGDCLAHSAELLHGAGLVSGEASRAPNRGVCEEDSVGKNWQVWMETWALESVEIVSEEDANTLGGALGWSCWRAFQSGCRQRRHSGN